MSKAIDLLQRELNAIDRVLPTWESKRSLCDCETIIKAFRHKKIEFQQAIAHLQSMGPKTLSGSAPPTSDNTPKNQPVGEIKLPQLCKYSDSGACKETNCRNLDCNAYDPEI